MFKFMGPVIVVIVFWFGSMYFGNYGKGDVPKKVEISLSEIEKRFDRIEMGDIVVTSGIKKPPAVLNVIKVDVGSVSGKVVWFSDNIGFGVEEYKKLVQSNLKQGKEVFVIKKVAVESFYEDIFHLSKALQYG